MDLSSSSSKRARSESSSNMLGSESPFPKQPKTDQGLQFEVEPMVYLVDDHALNRARKQIKSFGDLSKKSFETKTTILASLSEVVNDPRNIPGVTADEYEKLLNSSPHLLKDIERAYSESMGNTSGMPSILKLGKSYKCVEMMLITNSFGQDSYIQTVTLKRSDSPAVMSMERRYIGRTSFKVCHTMSSVTQPSHLNLNSLEEGVGLLLRGGC